MDKGEAGATDEFPHIKSCLSWAASIGATYALLTIIALVAGTVAAFWFGLGALLACIVALWEAGSKALAEEQRRSTSEQTEKE